MANAPAILLANAPVLPILRVTVDRGIILYDILHVDAVQFDWENVYLHGFLLLLAKL